MTVRFMTSILSVGALIAALAAPPAQAGQNDDLKRFLGAAVGLYILGQAIDNNHRDRVVIRQYAPRRHHGGHKVKRHRYGNHQWKRQQWQRQHRSYGCSRHAGYGKRCW